MSEENVKIVNVPKTKNPRKVEAGKRLGTMSQESKKKKKAAAAAALETANVADNNTADNSSSTDLKEIGLMVSVVGILVGVVGLYYRFGKSEAKCEPSEVRKTSPDKHSDSDSAAYSETQKSKPNSKFDTLD